MTEYLNVVCAVCGAALTVKTEQTLCCPNCGAEILAANGYLTGALPAPENVQYAPPPAVPEMHPNADAPVPVRMDSDSMIAAGAGSMEPPHMTQYRKHMRLWMTLAALWFLVYVLLTTVLMSFGNTFAALVELFAGASALGAVFPIHPLHSELRVLQKFAAFVLLLVIGGYSGIITAGLLNRIIRLTFL